MITAIKNSPISFKANYNLDVEAAYQAVVDDRASKINKGEIPISLIKDIVADGVDAGYKCPKSKISKSFGFLMCNGLCFSNKNNVIINHINPKKNTSQFLADIDNEVIKDYEMISKEGNKIDILLTGGLESNDKSVSLFKSLLNCIKKFNSDNTILWGQKSPNPLQIAYSAESDSYLINLRGFDLDKIKSIKDIAKYCFEVVEPGKNAKFFVKGKRIF